MIDFQSRDTRRGLDDGDDDDEVDDPDGSESAGEGDEGDHRPEDEAADHDHGEHADHDHHHHDVDAVGAAVVTVSSTRSLDVDPAGDVIAAAFEERGHSVVARELVADEFRRIQEMVDGLCDRDDVDVVVASGGTGVTPDDVTIEAVSPLFDKELPGFGELFRILSYEEIGTKVVGTRTTAGVADGVPVFCLPGSQNAAQLGAEEIIVEEAGHLAGLATRGEE